MAGKKSQTPIENLSGRSGHFNNGVFEAHHPSQFSGRMHIGYKVVDQDMKTGEYFPVMSAQREPLPSMGHMAPAKDFSAQADKDGRKANPGWHASSTPIPFQLTDMQGGLTSKYKGRRKTVVQVSMPEETTNHYERPDAQGGGWLHGGLMRVDRELTPEEMAPGLAAAREWRSKNKKNQKAGS